MTSKAGLKSELCPSSCVICRFMCHWQLCKLRGICKHITGAPVGRSGLAIAAEVSVGTYRGRAEVWANSIAPMVSPVVQPQQSWGLTSAALHQWVHDTGFVSSVPERHPGQPPEFPWLRWGWGQCPKLYVMSLHNG